MSRTLSLGFMKDTFKKILPMTVIFASVTVVISLITVFFNSWIFEGLGGILGGVNKYDFFEASPLIVLFATLGVPIFVISANSYMTKRADSDYYDALPQTRTQMAVSSMLTVFLCASATTVIAFGVSLGFAVLFVDGLVIPWVASILNLLAVILVEWLVVAVFSLACAITGTTFNALAVGFLIIVGPRAFMSIVNETVAATSPVLLSDSIIPLFDNKYNLYTILSLSNGAAFDSSAFVYTAVAAIGYTVLAVIAFNKRRSETATHASPSSLAQHIYRISASTLVSMLAIFLGFGYGFDVVLVVLAFMALVVYFGYELITTKRAKNLLGALAALPIFIAVNALIVGGIALCAEYEKNYAPTADEVDGVSIVLGVDDFYVDLESYTTLMSEKIVLSDIESRSIVTEALRDNVMQVEADTYYGNYISQSENYKFTTVKIKSGLRTEYRSIYIQNDDYMALVGKLAETDGYRELWYKLPERPEIVGAQYGNISMTETDSRELYSTVRDALINLGYEAWLELYSTADYSEASLTVSFETAVNGTDTTVYIHIPTEISSAYEKAEQMRMRLMHDKYEKAISMLDEFLSDDGEELYLSVTVCGVDAGDEYYVAHAFGYRSEFDECGSAEELVAFISSMLSEEYADYTDMEYLELTLTNYADSRNSVSISCKIPEGVTHEAIKAVFEKYGYSY